MIADLKSIWSSNDHDDTVRIIFSLASIAVTRTWSAPANEMRIYLRVTKMMPPMMPMIRVKAISTMTEKEKATCPAIP